MSYDLMVFDAKKAPKARDQFIKWYDKQTEWAEEHGYDDPAVSSKELKDWFMEMIQSFPQMDGPYAPSDEEWDNMSEELELHVTDYSIGREMIYAAFAWSLAREARDHMRALAIKHKVGFFDVSVDEGEIILP